MSSRRDEREGFDEVTRLALLEGDLDRGDAAIEKLAVRIDSLNKVLVGLLVAISATGITVAITAVVSGLGGG